MQLPLLQPVDNVEPFVSGDVKIAPSAAIASGVILQAASGCEIMIAAGVCIGMGAILHAYQGNIEVESGATIGAGVLVVGKSKIGANACIGAVATIFEHDLEARQVVPPASVIGESGREISGKSITPPPQTALTPKTTTTTNSDDNLSVNQQLSNSSEFLAETEPQNHTLNSQVNNQANNQQLSNSAQFSAETEADNNNSNSLVNQELANTSSSPDPEETENEAETENEIEQAKTQLQEEASKTSNTQIYGQEYVNRMMKTLFPHKNALSYPPDKED